MVWVTGDLGAFLVTAATQRLSRLIAHCYLCARMDLRVGGNVRSAGGLCARYCSDRRRRWSAACPPACSTQQDRSRSGFAQPGFARFVLFAASLTWVCSLTWGCSEAPLSASDGAPAGMMERPETLR